LYALNQVAFQGKNPTCLYRGRQACNQGSNQAIAPPLNFQKRV